MTPPCPDGRPPPAPPDLEWKIIYVGCAEDERYDQVLDSVLVGPVVTGTYRFIFQACPPDHTKLPENDVVGVTVVLLTCSYKGKEFIRVGYYVNNEYIDEELKENPPEVVQIDKLQRHILADKPRVTKFPVEFDREELPPAMDTSGQAGEDGMMMDAEQPMQPMQPSPAMAVPMPMGGEHAMMTA
mmetsp:Transcript_69025/g.218312  ORF Transcript_69025/g.218312 Transcript_69025/m.218312 type:complete len:185 (+) Transcript_69025:491-1045(+)